MVVKFKSSSTRVQVNSLKLLSYNPSHRFSKIQGEVKMLQGLIEFGSDKVKDSFAVFESDSENKDCF